MTEWDYDMDYDITVSEFTFTAASAGPEEELPNSENLTVTADGGTLTFAGNIKTSSAQTEPYYVNGEDGSLTVKYNAKLSNWNNINANVASIATGKNKLTLTIKNNGTDTAHVRIELSTANGSTKYNTSATQESVAVNTSDGSSYFNFTISGEEVSLFFFLDSHLEESGAIDGNLTFSDLHFAE